MEVRKTNSGWVVEVTNRACGMLYQGGVVGRVELYKRKTLPAIGIDYNADPEANYNAFASNIEVLVERARPDRVLKAGRTIQ